MSMTDDQGGRRCAWSCGASPSAFPGVVANSGRQLHRRRRARSTRCWARTAPARSTLVKIIYGVLHADEGEMLWDGEPVRVADPKAARALGIGMVFQHFSLFEAMTVLENIALGVDERHRHAGAGRRGSRGLATPTACRSTRRARSTRSRSASASGSRSSAASCRARSS